VGPPSSTGARPEVTRVRGLPPARAEEALLETSLLRGLRCPTRDGITLATDLIVPAGEPPYPAILLRTPYDKVRFTSRPELVDLATHGYLVAVQDCRGRFNSDGVFYPFVDESKDGYDAVEWLAGHELCDGSVGMLGGSYGGQTCWFAASEAPPALRAIAPYCAPPGDAWRNEPIWGGCFLMASAAWMVALGERSWHIADPMDTMQVDWDFYDAHPLETLPARAGTSSSWWDDWMSRPVYDEVWHQSGYEHAWPRMQVPALSVTGWYDMNFVGSPRNFVGLRSQGATPSARSGQQLVIGPWHHHVNQQREMSGVDYGPNALVGLGDYRRRFFDRWLKGEANGLDQDARVHVFVMGANEWWSSPDWPLPGTRLTPWYLHSDGRANSLKGDGALSPQPPAGSERPDTFSYDPRDPVRQSWKLYDGAVDDRVPTTRDDVLVYTSAVLDEPIDVVGPVSFVLHAASSALDTDWHVRLVDVGPDGTARFLCHGALRARFRDGWDAPRLLPPDEPVRYEIDMTATGIRFLLGHRIRIELSSSWLGRFDRNTNTGTPNVFRDHETVVAHQTVFHDVVRPSHVLLPVVPAPAEGGTLRDQHER
jgi:putative CocE/NonD family hydrolase